MAESGSEHIFEHSAKLLELDMHRTTFEVFVDYCEAFGLDWSIYKDGSKVTPEYRYEVRVWEPRRPGTDVSYRGSRAIARGVHPEQAMLYALGKLAGSSPTILWREEQDARGDTE
jgi:hypothetical protein